MQMAICYLCSLVLRVEGCRRKEPHGRLCSCIRQWWLMCPAGLRLWFRACIAWEKYRDARSYSGSGFLLWFYESIEQNHTEGYRKITAPNTFFKLQNPKRIPEHFASHVHAYLACRELKRSVSRIPFCKHTAVATLEKCPEVWLHGVSVSLSGIDLSRDP